MAVRPIPTPRLLFLLAVGVLPLSLAAEVRGVIFVVAVYDALLLVLAFLDFTRAAAGGSLAFERRVSPRLALGEREAVTIVVRNADSRDHEIELRDEPPPAFQAEGRRATLRVPARGAAEVTYWVTPPARGEYAFAALAVRGAGPLGLAVRQWRLPQSASVTVVPNYRMAARLELLGRRAHLLRTGVNPRRQRGEGRTFASLREYVRGDDARHIDWKATARRRKPIVREYEAERNQNVLLAVDAGRMMTARVGTLTKLDYAVNAALLMAHAAVGQGDKVGLMLFADEVLAYLPPRGGRRQLRQVLDLLASAEAGLVEPDYGQAFRYLTARRLQRALIPVFTDLVDARASHRLLAHVATLCPRHLPFLVAIADPTLEASAEAPPRGVDTVYRQAVARDLLHERAEALRQITARGGLALDVSPAQLSLAVVNRYLEVKQRGLL
jgi:uncharacterized protein (DUF58 family)